MELRLLAVKAVLLYYAFCVRFGFGGRERRSREIDDQFGKGPGQAKTWSLNQIACARR